MNKKIKSMVIMSLCVFFSISSLIVPLKQSEYDVIVCAPDDKIGGEIM